MAEDSEGARVQDQEWEIKLDLSDLVDPTSDPAELFARAQDAVAKQFKEKGEDYEKALMEENNVTKHDGLWTSDRTDVEQFEKDVLRIEKGIKDVEVDGPDVKIHTIAFNEPEAYNDIDDPRVETDSDQDIPILLVHGLGGTAVEFRQNYQILSQDRAVYGIDIPGFGLSSRNTCYKTIFDKDPAKAVQKCEERLVELLDKWREKQGIKEMIIIGHSMGGYVSMVYAMKHRERVRQLILLEPWGMLTKQESMELKQNNPHYKHNSLATEWAMALSKPFKLKPFSLLRVAGNAIASLVYDVLRSQNSVYESDLMQYFISVNTMRDPSGSGEDMFGTLSDHTYMYPVLSLYSRLPELPSYPPATIIYGDSHMFNGKPISFVEEGKQFQKKMESVGYSNIEILEAPKCGHHPHAENPDWFHDEVERILNSL